MAQVGITSTWYLVVSECGVVPVAAIVLVFPSIVHISALRIEGPLLLLYLYLVYIYISVYLVTAVCCGPRLGNTGNAENRSLD